MTIDVGVADTGWEIEKRLNKIERLKNKWDRLYHEDYQRAMKTTRER